MRSRRSLPAVLALLLASPLAAQAQRPDPTLDVARWGEHEVAADRLLVTFAGGTSAAVQHVRHEQSGAELLSQLRPDVALVRLPEGLGLQAAMTAYGNRAEVLAVEPDVLHRPSATIPSDLKWHLQWGLSKVDAPAAWDLARGDADCIVAVIDSGVDADHPDLADHYAFGWDHYAGDADPADADGHGTHCAGVAAAETDNATGVAGMGFHCRFAAYRVGNSTFPSSAIVAAIDDAVADGCHVLSMSFSSSYNSMSIRNALLDARDAGLVLVAAAGNSNSTSKVYPAAHDFVIGVASSAPDDSRSSFSNHGSWVDLAAPGQSIFSTVPNGYAYMSGTSMATPLVAGLATLLYAQLGGTRSEANAALVRDALQDSAVDVGGWVTHGRVDAPAAVGALGADTLPQLTGVTPLQVENLGGDTVSLAGSGFVGIDVVWIADNAAEDLVLSSGEALSFTAPPAPGLGPIPIMAQEGVSLSNTLQLTYVEADPPRIVADATVAGGAPFSWQLGAGAGDGAWLLLSVSPTTVPFKGQDLLASFIVAWTGTLDARGLASLPVTMPAGVGPLTFHAQLVALDGAGFALSAPVATTLQP